MCPLAAGIGFTIWVAFRTGELTPSDAIVRAMASTSTPVVVGIGLSDSQPYINLQSVLLRNPEVLVLGSSRSESIRSDFFIDPSKVFIAAQTTQQMSDFGNFLGQIPATKNPKVLIIGLDQYFFNPNYAPPPAEAIDALLTQPISAYDVLANWPMIYWHLFKGDITISELLKNHSGEIGIGAIKSGTGYRNDGSHDPGTILYANDDSILSDIKQGIGGFEYADKISSAAVAGLDAFLNECKTRGISVVGFLPPFSPQIYQILTSPPNHYDYLQLIMPAIEPVFAKYGYRVYDFTNPASLGITANEMLNGTHPTERGALISFAKMAADDPALWPYADPKFLAATLRATARDRSFR